MDLGKYIENNNQEQDELLKLESDIEDIDNIYKNINEIIHAQGEVLDNIADNMESVKHNAIVAVDELKKADNYFRSYKYYQYTLYGLAIVGTLLLIL
jgi:t-SNARE complex subunit (syntaxin)